MPYLDGYPFIKKEQAISNEKWFLNWAMYYHHVPKRSFMEAWTLTIQQLNPASTPALLASLNTAAQFCHSDERLNRMLTHLAEHNLLNWLKTLPIPPHAIIYAWEKAFEKARFLTHEGKYGRTQDTVKRYSDSNINATWKEPGNNRRVGIVFFLIVVLRGERIQRFDGLTEQALLIQRSEYLHEPLVRFLNTVCHLGVGYVLQDSISMNHKAIIMREVLSVGRRKELWYPALQL
ncbi:hypothetical protein BDQ17DRAFT_1328669 [Cyathus striatus]|nr:hypothetical protein BDQ17DRAFT_1328669 [Cyathus striatus]